MAYSERVLILTEAEQEVFYGNPQLTNNDQRYFFALNDKERNVANQLRGRRQRCMFVVLLGYFKSKPIVLQPRYFQLKDDLKYVSENTLPGVGHRPFNLSSKESERIYQRIFSLCQYERWRSELHEKALTEYLQKQAMIWSEPRSLFDAVRQSAFDIISKTDLESVCLFLNDQRRSIDEATWQYYEQRDSLRVGLIRELFLCLRFEGSEGSERLAHTLNQVQVEFTQHSELAQSEYNKRHLPQKQRPFLLDKDQNLKLKRYEWYLYLQIPSRLNGKLTLPEIAKYQALEADLVNTERWKKDKELLVEQTQLPKLALDPALLIQELEQALDSRLRAVSDYLDKADNRNVVLRNPKGKRSWRLPAGSKSAMVNNPFFAQLPTTAVADALRMVDRDTGFIECFRHVLDAQSKNRVYEQDLLAILAGNATNQGTYGISQRSDRSYEQLSTIQANYLRLETIEAANDCINNATARLPIFKHYNIQEDIVHASADGQKFEAKRDTFKTRYSSKYFGPQKGVSAMSLIANHAAINARVINEMFAVAEDEAGKINLSLRTPINTRCIALHWDKIQHIVVPLKERKTTQALLVRKLSTYKKTTRCWRH